MNELPGSPGHGALLTACLMVTIYLQAAIALLVLIASCGAEESSTTAPATSASTTATTETDDSQTTISATTSSEPRPEPTSTTTADTTGSLTLRADGLGLVEFGQPADEVTQILEDLIGTPPTDQGDEAGWVKYVGWRDLGLFVGFDKPESSEYTGVSRFVGWDYWPPAGLGLVTDEGIGIGSTLVELRAAYGDRLQVPDEPDECAGDWMYLLRSASGEVEIIGTLDRPPADDAEVAMAHAGMGVGC